MSAAKFKVGDRVRYAVNGTLVRTVVVAEPDADDRIVMLDSQNRYFIKAQSDYESAPQRFTVELRVPKAGERYIYLGNIGEANGEHTGPRPVIVDEGGA